MKSGFAWIVDPKNTETVRVEMSDEALGVIKQQTKRGEFVFCHKNGNPYKTNLHDVIKNAASRAGVGTSA